MAEMYQNPQPNIPPLIVRESLGFSGHVNATVAEEFWKI